MKITAFLHCLTISSLCLTSNAFPLFSRNILQDRQPIPQQSYSVVAVDGGSVTPTTVATRTTTDLMTATQTQFTTILSTIVITQSNTPVTIVVTTTSAITITQAGSTAVVTATPAPEIETVTVQPGMTSSAYDNGQWHTTYYSVWAATPSSTGAASSSASSKPDALAATISSYSNASSASPTSTISNSTTSAPTTTNWATYYGQAYETPKNGSWWGKKQ